VRVLGHSTVLAEATDPGTKVITGHFGLAAGSKSADYRAPLWSLMLATVWLDVVFIPLLLLDVETIETPPEGGYGTSVIHADYTHSLLGALVLSAAFGAVAWWRWDRRLGLLLGGVAFSHWVLDLIVHRGDLPILPGNAGDLPLLGFGLWKVPVASIALEVALLLGGVFLYWRAARSVGSRPPGRVSPSMVAGALLACGVIVMAIDALGI
jgi:LexA-binding, inner membrane-associated putative hydrolase